MGVLPVRGLRVSTSMQTQVLIEQIRSNTLRLFEQQQKLASGQSMLLPSDDPDNASRALKVSDLLERYNQFYKNADFASRFTAATETALADVREIINEAVSIASQNVGILANSEQRASAAAIIDSMIDQLVAIANRQHEGIYLFAGQKVDTQPFVQASGGVLYQGDTNSLTVNLDGQNVEAISFSGADVFGALSAEVRGWVDLDPAVTLQTRLSDLRGANGEGIRLGTIVINEVGGAGAFTVDLSQCGTLGDVVAAINVASASAGATVTASLTSNGLRLDVSTGLQISVTEQGEGQTASDLGILQPVPLSGPLIGGDLDPKLTLTTPVSALRGGAGIDLTSGLVISDGNKTVTLDISSAQTIQDILNAINSAGLGVLARIGDDERRIDVVSRLSGGSLSIGENGGSTASHLGIRSMHGGTALSSLNDGKGVSTVSGSDIRVTAKDGSQFEVDLSGASTIQDVIDAINAAATAAGVAVTASLATVGNGIRLVDSTGGTGTLKVESVNFSSAAADLGILKETSGSELVGDDVNPIRPDGIFTALYMLHDALLQDDTQAITEAGQRLEEILQRIGLWQGKAGALSKSVLARRQQLDDEITRIRTLLSDIKDVDLTEVITRFGHIQTVFQANLLTGAKIFNLSLLDFLR